MLSPYRSIRWACDCVLRATLADYTLTQYPPSLLAYSVLETVVQLCLDDRCLSATVEDTSSSAAAAATGLDPSDVKNCMIAVRNFLHDTGSRLVVCPVFY